MFSNQGPWAIRQPIRGARAPASLATAEPTSAALRARQALGAAHLRRHGLVERRADRLVDGASRAGWRWRGGCPGRGHPAREVDGGEVAVVDIARDDRHRDGRLAVRAVLPGREPGQQLLQLGERGTERRPVLQVEPPTQALASARGPASPGAGADLLVPGLQGVDAARQQRRHGGGENHVLPVAGDRLGEPPPFRLVGDQPPFAVHHAAAARVEHDHADLAEAASERPAHARCALVGAVRELGEQRGRIAPPRIFPQVSSSASSLGERLPRCWYTQ